MRENSGADERPSAEQIESLLQGGQAVYLTPMYYGEVGVSNRLGRLMQDRTPAPLAAHHGSGLLDSFHGMDWERKFAQLEERASNQPGPLRLESRQREAVQAALTNWLTVLTGGPGTGKTTVVRTIIELLRAGGREGRSGRAHRPCRQAPHRGDRPVREDGPQVAAVPAGSRHVLQTQRAASALTATC